VRDVTGLVEVENRVTEADRVRQVAEAQFATVFEQAGIGSVIIGLDGCRRGSTSRVRAPRRPAGGWRPAVDQLQPPDESPLVDGVLARWRRATTYTDDSGTCVGRIRRVSSTYVSLVQTRWGARLPDRPARGHHRAQEVETDSPSGTPAPRRPPNRALLTDRLVHSLAGSHPRPSRRRIVDVDRFKPSTTRWAMPRVTRSSARWRMAHAIALDTVALRRRRVRSSATTCPSWRSAIAGRALEAVSHPVSSPVTVQRHCESRHRTRRRAGDAGGLLVRPT
jgi:hypothetical protein